MASLRNTQIWTSTASTASIASIASIPQSSSIPNLPRPSQNMESVWNPQHWNHIDTLNTLRIWNTLILKFNYFEFEDHNFMGPPLGPRHDAQEGSPPAIGESESTVQWRWVRADGLMISGSLWIFYDLYVYCVYVYIYIYVCVTII